MKMLPYPKAVDTPNRKLRKSQRNVIWLKNRKAKKSELKLRRENRAQTVFE